MAKLKFTKMNGLGNDFVVLDYNEYKKSRWTPDKLALKLCNRNFGIGADGLIIVNPYSDIADISWIFCNSDGSLAQMCGNGMRCFARYVSDNNLVSKKKFLVETVAGIIIPEMISDDEVKVNMGMPVLEPKLIPCRSEFNLSIPYTVNGKDFTLNAVSMGNPHCVIFTDQDSKNLALEYGPLIENDTIFPEKTNVEFVEIISRNEVTVNVWERGCGITLACGTGACATVVAGVLNDYLDNDVKVNLPGGSLNIKWLGRKSDPDHNVYMTGSADYSFTGEILI